MKQTITVDQLEELSQKARHKLNAYLLGMKTDQVIFTNGTKQMCTMMAPLEDSFLNIGQMIEFLNIKESNAYDGGFIDKNYEDDCWTVFANSNYYEKEELCDALWEAVKERLEK